MAAFLIFMAVLLLLELCCRAEEMSNKCRNEYHIIVLKNTKDDGDSSDEADTMIPDYSKNRLSHYQ